MRAWCSASGPTCSTRCRGKCAWTKMPNSMFPYPTKTGLIGLPVAPVTFSGATESRPV